MKRIVLDIDNTICVTKDSDYLNSIPEKSVIKKINEYHKAGFEIVFYTSRNMKTHNKNLGKINAFTLPIIIDWLNKNEIPFDEIHVGKPWCGTEGFYVDDKAIRPNEFVELGYHQILQILEK